MDPISPKQNPIKVKKEPANLAHVAPASPIMEPASPKVDLAKMRMLRRRKGISQREMARTLGYKSAVGYHYLETGRCAIQAEQLFCIAERLGVPIGELFLQPSCTNSV